METDKHATKSPFVTVAEASRILRVHRVSVYRLVREGKIPFVRVGNVIRIPRLALIPQTVSCHCPRCVRGEGAERAAALVQAEGLGTPVCIHQLRERFGDA